MGKNNDDIKIITMNDEFGKNPIDFNLLDTLQYSGNSYAILIPVEPSDDYSVVVMQLEAVSENKEIYVSVNDEKILKNVFKLFKQKLRNECNFTE